MAPVRSKIPGRRDADEETSRSRKKSRPIFALGARPGGEYRLAVSPSKGNARDAFVPTLLSRPGRLFRLGRGVSSTASTMKSGDPAVGSPSPKSPHLAGAIVGGISMTTSGSGGASFRWPLLESMAYGFNESGGAR